MVRGVKDIGDESFFGRVVSGRSRRRRWALWAGGTLLAVAFVALDAWALWRWLRVETPVAVAMQVAPAAVPRTPRHVTTGGTAAAAGRRAAVVCGVDDVPVDAGDAFALARYVSALTRKSGREWLARLLESDSYRARAAGLFLEGKVAEDGLLLPIREATRNTLVQLAVGAADPAVYALALYACSTPIEDPTTSACQQISVAGWSRLEPDNAVPWLLVAARLRVRGDAPGETEAIGHAAVAGRFDAYNDSLFAFAAPELPVDASPLVRAYLATEVLGVESAYRLGQYGEAGRYCGLEAVRDPVVQRQCAALAELLVVRGTNLLDLGLGAAIGARAGWPAARVAAVVQERDALMAVIARTTPQRTEDLWTCDGVRLGSVYLAQRVRDGELGAARDALERSGRTMEELAREEVAWVETRQREAAASLPP